MNRKNFYFKQKVKESELDAAFDDVDSAIKSFLRSFGYVGIAKGAVVTENSPTNLTVVASGPAIVYDQNQNHIEWFPNQVINCALDENGAATTVAGVGNEKWLSIFAKFEEVLSDPRTDGNGATVYFERDESFALHVAQGAEAGAGLAVRPPLRGDEILLADVKIVQGQTAIVNANISTTRSEVVYILAGTPLSVSARGLEDVLQAMLDKVNLGGALNASNTWTEAPQYVNTNDSTKALLSTTKKPQDDPAGAARKLLMSAPGEISGTTVYFRVYVTSDGHFELTQNAGFNPTTDQWVADRAASVAFQLRTTGTQLWIDHKAAGAGTWATWDTVDATGLSDVRIAGEYGYRAAKTRTFLIDRNDMLPQGGATPHWDWIITGGLSVLRSLVNSGQFKIGLNKYLPQGCTVKRIRIMVDEGNANALTYSFVKEGAFTLDALPGAPALTTIASGSTAGDGSINLGSMAGLSEVVDKTQRNYELRVAASADGAATPDHVYTIEVQIEESSVRST